MYFCNQAGMRFMNFPAITIELPEWVTPFIAQKGEKFSSIEERMALVLELARCNIEQKTGGPFAAAVFNAEGRLLAPGVNLVTSANCSILHAEMVALAVAQKVLGRFDISDGGIESFDLIASTEPCAMCFGALPWSGIRRLICGARDEDARSIGFDEGPKLSDWQEALETRGITVIRDVLREHAAETLKAYAASSGTIYNSR
jgi:tRNA(Arg) A34 adenosine deaminase TadA